LKRKEKVWLVVAFLAIIVVIAVCVVRTSNVPSPSGTVGFKSPIFGKRLMPVPDIASPVDKSNESIAGMKLNQTATIRRIAFSTKLKHHTTLRREKFMIVFSKQKPTICFSGKSD